ncbi:putative GTP-binding protein EngB [Candidatus Hepatincola sp. Pdp]
MSAINPKIFLQECKFVLGVASLKQIPKGDIPEFVFWGRSNVGKSSLINKLVNRKKLVRVSNTPGRTRELNYFTILEQLYLVDLPGYGYAKVSQQQKMQWEDLLIGYFNTSTNIKRVFLLIDAKVGFKTIDQEVMAFLNTCGLSYQIVFTKSDKIKQESMAKLIAETKDIIAKNGACFPEFIVSSTKSKIGIAEIQQVIIGLLSSKVSVATLAKLDNS